MTLQRPVPVVALLLFVSAVTGGCGGEDGGRSAAGATSTSTSTVPDATSSTTTTTSPAASPVPVELRGGWQTTLDDGASAILRLGESSYQIRRSGTGGGGTVAVEGDEITFSTSLCSVVSSYRWALDDGRLTLTPTGTDPCPRAVVLAGRTFERES